MHTNYNNDKNKENKFSMNSQNILKKNDTILLATSSSNIKQPSQIDTTVIDSNSKACIFGSYPSSLITQSNTIDENTQIKRARFLAESFSSTYTSNDSDKQTNTLTENRNYRKIDSFDSVTSNVNSNENDFLFESINNSENLNDDTSRTLNKEMESPSYYGLPFKVKDLLKKLRNISCLYDWQHDLLTIMVNKLEKLNDFLKDGTNFESNDLGDLFLINLLYLSPTSGGKTLVAEMLMLYCLLRLKKNCIFIMPFVSIVQEKVQLMVPFGENLNFNVEEYAGVKGNLPPIKRRKPTLFICTIEKSHSLINSLIETDRLSNEVGLVVADEMHMIGDGSRGAIYEMTLSKVKYCSKLIVNENMRLLKKNLVSDQNRLKLPIQIVATTATLQNKKELASFLDAFLYERDFRPVELKEYIKLNNQVFEIDKKNMNKYDDDNQEGFTKLARTIDTSFYSNQQKKDDPDGLVALVKEVIPDESCLIFCSTKKNCENVASLISQYLNPELKKYKRDEKLKLFNELREENSNNICPVLRQSLQFGIAYHHSGLTTEERQLIERAYREGVLCLLTCTSTLAAGVNLPAKRVIIRSPYVAKDFMQSNQYKQMIGRAGRAGMINSTGESILLFQLIDKQKVYDLICAPSKICESSFECNDSKAIRVLVLSLISLKLTHYGSEILLFFKQTLFYMQQKKRLDKKKEESASEEYLNKGNLVPEEFSLISNALLYLAKNKFINLKKTNDTWYNIEDLDKENETSLNQLFFTTQIEVTKLGIAAIKGNIDLDSVNQLYEDLNTGLKSIVLSNSLHLLYLCTPYELVNSLLTIDFETYCRKFCNLKEDEIKCAKIIGISEDYLQKQRFQKTNQGKKINENVIKRFYMTLIIYELWKTNNSIWKTASEFSLDRGFVQNITQSAASFTSGVAHFCENLDEFWPYKNLLSDFTKRLQHNCSPIELTSLLELENVRLPRAKQLFTAGYKTIELVASSKPEEMCSKVNNMALPVAGKIIKSAKRILREKIEILQAEADNILLQINIMDDN